MIPLLLALLSTARATDLVVHAEAADVAVAERVAAAAGVEWTDLRPRNLATLLDRPPMLLGSGTVLTCLEADTTLSDVRAHIAAVESSILFLDYAQAMSDADEAMDALGCLREPADGEVASRVMFLRGIALYYAGNLPGARDAFRQAHLFQPGLAWDDTYPPEPRALFDQALVDLAGSGTAALAVVPGPSAVPVFVDGRRITRRVSIAAGEHLVQVGANDVITVRVDLPEGAEAELVVPEAIDARAVSWAADPDRQGDLGRLLGALLGDGFVVYVHHGGRTWRTTTGGGTWEELAPATRLGPDPVVTDPPTPTETVTLRTPIPDNSGRVEREKRRLWWLLPPGIGAVGFGAGYGTHSYVQARKAYTAAAQADTPADWDIAAADYEKWGDRLTTAQVVGGLGVALTVAGVAVRVDDALVVPDVGGGRLGVQVFLRR